MMSIYPHHMILYAIIEATFGLKYVLN